MYADENFELERIYAGAPRTLRGRPTYISADPKGKRILYCNGNSVFIRNIDNPTDCDVYTQHAKDTTCAAYSPSGNYICSGDISGKVRIWDALGKEHILKYEYQPLAGAIKDIAWTEDSKRICVVGEGRETFGAVFLWDTGSSCGSINGPVKACNNVTIKPNRPYRLVVASEDFSSFFFEGPPFKFQSVAREHSNFVNCARYSPDGKFYATAGADGKCYIYDGKTGELLKGLHAADKKVHQGGIYSICWSPDSKNLLTVSADKCCKIHSLDEANTISNKELCHFRMGVELGDMQLGCVWAGEHLITVSLNGNINYLDVPSQNIKTVVKGHNKAIVCSCLTEDKKTLFTGSFDGAIYYWDLETGVAELVDGTGHTNKVQSISCCGKNIVTCGMDDTVRFIEFDENAKIYKYIPSKVVALDSQPQGISAGPIGMAAVACNNELIILRDMRKDVIIKDVTIKYEGAEVKTEIQGTCVDLNTNIAKMAVGTFSAKVLMFDIVKGKMEIAGSIPLNGDATDVKFSPDGKYIAMCTGKKQVKVVLVDDFTVEKVNHASHAVKVNAISWSPDSNYVASCGIDGAVYTWSVATGAKVLNMRGAHSQAVDVTSLQWPAQETLITTGRQDCSIRKWRVGH